MGSLSISDTNNDADKVVSQPALSLQIKNDIKANVDTGDDMSPEEDDFGDFHDPGLILKNHELMYDIPSSSIHEHGIDEDKTRLSNDTYNNTAGMQALNILPDRNSTMPSPF